ncbi:MULTISPECIES: BTAD domain-containing putative transcriptional regulator [Actinosynnema]|uniref:AfsR/SARP family transcriptional regulator n=1 Tax=Actinosynnema TaxID=40566 RepID=UPI0020A4E06E|nr:BTAD domain-containing putative transcriptional regulator [Actinosynnema pretiosum]MCP2097791.1 DNA-binding transcriptional activator of the SARP family [Actinosynnema pretiosum]
MRFLLLGPVTAYRRGEPVVLGRRAQRLVLGLLLLSAGRPVPVERLEALLWEGDPPDGARALVQTHVSRLRRVLDPARDGATGFRLVARGSTYTAEVAPETVDAHRFRVDVERAAELADPERRACALRAALALWQGPLLSDVADDALRDRVGAGLAELRLSAWESCAEADLAAGRHRRAAAELADLVAEEPTRETLVVLLMTALCLGGRGSAALALFERTRRVLAAELGADPGPELRGLHRSILRGERVPLLR